MTTDSGDAAPIRTPDQRLRVFVSSTLAELAPERAAVARAISALRLTPVMFELGARPHPPRGALPRLLGAVGRVRRSVLAALWVDRARDGHLGTRGRVPPVRRDAPAPLHEVAGPGAGAAVGGDDLRPPVRGGRLLPIVQHHTRARPARARRPRAAPQRAVRDGGFGGGAFGRAGGDRDQVSAPLAADAVDLVDRSRGRHRRAVRVARVIRRAVGHA